jgi:hypothetical protein
MKQATTAPSRQAMTSGKDDSKGIAEDPSHEAALIVSAVRVFRDALESDG